MSDDVTCGNVVRATEGVQGSNVAARNLSDISDIDTWLDEREHEKTADTLGAETWTVKTPFPGICKVRYERRNPGSFVVSLMRLGPIPPKLEFICACLGLQPCHIRNLTDAGEPPEWGAFQILGMYSLPLELFDAVTKRLNEAVEANLKTEE
jgi:hypothetical protein